MDTTRLIISSVICAVILFFVARVILKRNKEADQLEEELNKDELFTLKQETGDFFEEPDEQRFIPDEEIENYTGENEKEIARVNNYLLKNETKNLDKIEFHDLQESILISDFGEFSNRFSVDHIYQVGEKRYVAVLNVPEIPGDETAEQNNSEKQLMGIIQCPHRMGNGRFIPYKFNEETPGNDGLFSSTNIRIGNYILIPEGFIDVTYIESLCNKIDELRDGYKAYITGNTIYIRNDRPAALKDLMTLIDMLKNHQY